MAVNESGDTGFACLELEEARDFGKLDDSIDLVQTTVLAKGIGVKSIKLDMVAVLCEAVTESYLCEIWIVGDTVCILEGLVEVTDNESKVAENKRVDGVLLVMW